MRVFFKRRGEEKMKNVVVHCSIFCGIVARVELLHQRLIEQKRIKEKFFDRR